MRDRSPESASVGLSQLAAAIHPTRLAARLDPALSAATLVRLQKSRRLQVRLAGLLLDDEMNLNEGRWGQDLLRGHDPRRAALLAGSLWHARSLLKLISKPDLTVLIQSIGAEAHAFGIRHLAHAIATGSIDDPEQLAQQIEHDGHACLGAWLDENSALDRDRVLLRLPVGTAADEPAIEHRNAAGQLFSLVVAYLVAETPTK
ncbi:nodulation protein NolU [Mesorhizobium sp. YC-39]|uniref:nodulation protein NolU n=1 Tax=unclassified Mesorhizobium TaxID=325217 RepID=UPI0021E75F12|nr:MULTISPECIES: nodulation protein NolU [unclassified Mesorhizobium]MCV3211081.1 nodulation protein NolU [Mesorhizobium sp. YC-2]MCV3232806.1 nodulation protein NolU [Mesorhizobium sp. YC-39]